MRWVKYVAHEGGKRSECRDFEGIPDAKRPLEKPRHE
jgi:hypothetical protein